MREKECLAKCFHWKICDFVSGKLSKYLYLHSYTHLITSSALNEWFLIHKFKKRGLLHRVSITDNEYEANMIDNKCHKIYLSGPFGFSVLRHPNHLLLAGANNRNVFITYRFLTCVAGAWKWWLKERTGAREGDTFPFFLVPTTSKRLLRRLTDSSPGAPNDGMLPRTPEVSQMVFTVLWKPVWLIWSCPKNYLSVWMS